MAKAKKPKATAHDVREALRLRYGAPEFANLEEVGNATGYGTRRHIDMVAVGLWPSRGLHIHGIEIKVSRQDFLKELKNPAKAEVIQKYCHYWWIAVGDANIVKPGDLPKTWGLLVLHGKQMRCAVEAPALKPEALAMPFVAAMLRRAQEAQAALIGEAEEGAYARGTADGPEYLREDVERAQRATQKLRDQIDKFKTHSGVDISTTWVLGDIGSAVRQLIAAAARRRLHRGVVEELERGALELEGGAKRLRAAKESFSSEREVLEAMAPQPTLDE